MIEFLKQQPFSEYLDNKQFAEIIGSKRKADFLLNNRKIVGELKKISSSPRQKLESRLKKRFALPDAPRAYGQVSLAHMVERLHDADLIGKMLADITTRAVRRDLNECNVQIAITKDIFKCSDAAGLSVLMNDTEPIIDASAMGYAARYAIENSVGNHSHINFIWISVEAHRLSMPGGRVGFPQMLAWREDIFSDQYFYLESLIRRWAEFNGASLVQIEHGGSWDNLVNVFFDGPPTIDMY